MINWSHSDFFFLWATIDVFPIRPYFPTPKYFDETSHSTAQAACGSSKGWCLQWKECRKWSYSSHQDHMVYMYIYICILNIQLYIYGVYLYIYIYDIYIWIYRGTSLEIRGKLSGPWTWQPAQVLNILFLPGPLRREIRRKRW
jgi:hypothetical protein